MNVSELKIGDRVEINPDAVDFGWIDDPSKVSRFGKVVHIGRFRAAIHVESVDKVFYFNEHDILRIIP